MLFIFGIILHVKIMYNYFDKCGICFIEELSEIIIRYVWNKESELN